MVKPENKMKSKLLVKYLRSGIYRTRTRQQMAKPRQFNSGNTAQELTTQTPGPSNSQTNQDQPSAAPTITTLVLPRFFHNCMDSNGKLLYNNLVTKNEHGHLCTLWRRVRTDNANVKIEEDDDSPEPERPDISPYPAFDSNMLIKREPMSDIEEDLTTFDTTTQALTSETIPVLNSVAIPANADEECRAYGKFVEEKLKNFSQQTRDFVQHAFSNIIYEASLRANY